jgi:hypothetical protein
MAITKCRAVPLSIKRQQPIKMLRVVFLAILCLLATPCAGVAQQPKKPPWVCFLTFDPGTLRTRSPRFDGFFEGLQELGLCAWEQHQHQLSFRGQ